MRRDRILTLTLLGVLALAATAEARTYLRMRRGPNHTTLVVAHTHPIARRPYVVVRPLRHPVAVTAVRYEPIVFWTPVVVTYPNRDMMVWEDSEMLSQSEGWTDFTLGVNQRGEKLFVEVAGKAQLNFADVVFENGDCQVVDFKEKACGPGIYSLLDFKDGRKVSHVRMVARAKSDEAKIVLKMRV